MKNAQLTQPTFVLTTVSSCKVLFVSSVQRICAQLETESLRERSCRCKSTYSPSRRTAAPLAHRSAGRRRCSPTKALLLLPNARLASRAALLIHDARLHINGAPFRGEWTYAWGSSELYEKRNWEKVRAVGWKCRRQAARREKHS